MKTNSRVRTDFNSSMPYGKEAEELSKIVLEKSLTLVYGEHGYCRHVGDIQLMQQQICLWVLKVFSYYFWLKRKYIKN